MINQKNRDVIKDVLAHLLTEFFHAVSFETGGIPQYQNIYALFICRRSTDRWRRFYGTCLRICCRVCVDLFVSWEWRLAGDGLNRCEEMIP